MEQVHRPAAALAVDVEHEAVRAAVERAGPEAGDERRDDERRPRRGEPEARDARRVDQHRAAEDSRRPSRSVSVPPANDPDMYAMA